ncbi:carboxypeptidase-like regulatory domain-containing protein [Gemmatimonas sp.]
MREFRLVPRLVLPGATLAFGAATAHAQSAETLRGRVTSDSGRVVTGATVLITRGPDRLVQQGITSDSGTFRITFENGTGDYLVAVQATGFKPARRRVTRQGAEREYVVDFTLSSNVVSLEAVKIAASKPVRVSTGISPTQQDPGSSERFNEGVVGGVSPVDAGSITATVSTVPGATMAGGSLSMLGASGSSNLTTLNGMAMGAGSVPRAARVNTRVTGATFDATRGGFSGANVDVRLGPGSRNFQNRSVFATFDGAALQATDAIGRALGATNTNWRGSAGMDGEAIRNTLTYNVAIDASRTTRIRPDLADANPLAYQLSGISLDSVQRVRSLAATSGLPLAYPGVPTGVRRDALSAMARFDDTRDTTRTHSLVMYINESRGDNEGTLALSAPSSGAARLDRAAGAIWTLGQWSGAGFSTYNETRLNVGTSVARNTPYSTQPAVDVLVRTLADATANDAGVAALSLGGRGSDESNTTRITGEAAHEFQRNIRGRRHQVKAIAWGRVDALDQTGGAMVNGRYGFASLDDFAANRPNSYSRTLTNPERHGESWNSAAAVSHTYNPSRFFSLLYGARVEANGLLSSPDRNSALENTLGVRTGGVQPVVHISPRVGFSYTFNKSARNGGGMSMNGYGTWYRFPTGVLRGGIGEFRDLWRPDAVADAAARTGLAGSTLSLSCVGAAVPPGNWSLLSSASAPTQCRDGSGALAERAPSVTLLGRGYDAPRSWRANLDYNATRWQLMLRASALGTYDLNQASTTDANFSGTSRFTLANEGNRPVFVSPGAIDGSTGAVSAAESRRSTEYGRVGVLQSDLRGRGGQLTVGLGPDRFSRFWRNWPFWSANYTVQRIDRQVRGFDGAANGDPRIIEWAPAWSDARHVWLLQAGHQGKFGTVSIFGRLQSGLPFTPLVQGDVNGDGRSGDRAYVPNPAATTDAALAAGLRALQAGGSDVAKDCLARSIANPLARNACRGPWTRTVNLTWSPPVDFGSKSWRQRVNMTVFANNVLGGIDQLVHGSNNMRGWGGVATPDATLLVPRGFDAASRAFRYDVNPRFGETRPSRTTWREPFRVTIDVNVRLHVDYDVQTLRRVLEPVRMNGGYERRGIDSLMSRYLSETSSIHRALVFEADSLFLRPDQIAKLRQQDSVFAEQVRAVYRPLAEYLVQVPEGRATAEALAKAKEAKDAYWEIFWKQPEIAASALDSPQIELMSLLKDMITVPQGKRKGSQYYFGSSVTLKHTVPQVRKD